MSAIADQLTRAVQAQKRGEVDAATELLGSVLRDHPDDVNALQLLGLVHLGQGRLEAADELISRALTLRPDVAELYNNRGLCRLRQGRLAEAEFDLLQAIGLKPEYPEAFNNLGLTLQRLGRFENAEAAFIRAIKLQPDYAVAYTNLGALVLKLGRLDAAAACCRRALTLKPEHPPAEVILALTLEKQGQAAEADARFRRALSLAPSALAWTGLGRLLRRKGLTAEAEQCLRSALALDENGAEALSELGFALLEMGKWDEARATARKALERAPDSAEAHRLLGGVLRESGDLKDAEACYRRCLELDRDNVEAHCELATLHLLTGRWRSGWRGLEWRQRRSGAPRPPVEQPLWDGSPLEGKTILLWSGPEISDAIQFARYARLVKERGGRVILRAPEAIAGLLRSEHIGADRVASEGEPLPACDVHAPLISLPGLFGTTPETAPSEPSYFSHFDLDAAAWMFWQQRLEQFPGERVGLFWRSDAGHRGDAPVDALAPLGAVAGISLIDLSRPSPSNEHPDGARDLGLAFHEAGWNDLAAIVAGLDLAICIDSPVAHLAAALGVPVWLTLPATPDWRWLLERADSPWYPSMRLFRQERLGEWAPVFGRVASELDQWVQSRSTGSSGRRKRRASELDFTDAIYLGNP